MSEEKQSQSQVMTQMDRLSGLLECLEKGVERLETRNHIILIPPEPPPEDETQKENITLVPLAHTLQCNNNTLSNLVDKLNNIIDRIEV